MRNVLIKTLCDLAEIDSRIFLLTADLGWSVVEPFAERYPDRFLNVGVAEQNMIGVATGLAMLGYIPFAYSIAAFSSMRCYEQSRNGPVLHNLPVRLLGIGGGFAYGHAGATHHALEDLALARTQPSMLTIAPADGPQARNAILATLEHPGPAYLRIGKGPTPDIPGLQGRFALGQPEVVCPGDDMLFLCTGEIAKEALRAAEILATRDLSASVAVLAHLPYEPSLELTKLLAAHRHVLSVEEGYTSGGLAALAAQTIASRGLACRLTPQGIDHTFHRVSGSATYLQRKSGLSAEQLAETAEHICLPARRRLAA